MRELTFKGYLLSQLKDLSELDSTSLYAFSRLSESNFRLQNTLCLYLQLYTEADLKEKILRKFEYLQAPCKTLSSLSDQNLETFLLPDSLSEYKTVYDNFVYMRDRKHKEDSIKALMHTKIVERQSQKGITNYRVYKALDLNPGNINAYLKYCDTSKVSLDTVRNVLAFVNAY